MKRIIIIVLCLSSLFNCFAAEPAQAQAQVVNAIIPVAQTQKLVFVDDEKKELVVPTEMCKKFTLLKNLLDDDLQEDEIESIPVHNCSKQTFEDLVVYYRAAGQRDDFLRDLHDHTRVIAMIIAADHLIMQEIIVEEMHDYSYDLMEYAITHFNEEQLQNCFENISPTIIRATLKNIEKAGFENLKSKAIKGVIKAANYLNESCEEYYHYSFDVDGFIK